MGHQYVELSLDEGGSCGRGGHLVALASSQRELNTAETARARAETKKLELEIKKMELEMKKLELETKKLENENKSEAIENNVTILQCRKKLLDAHVPTEWVDYSLPLPRAPH